MVTIENFNEVTKDLSSESIIKMSNHTKDYTIANPDCSNAGSLFYSASEGLMFNIDWNNNRIFTLAEFKNMVEINDLESDEEIISWDMDDGNMIQFESVVIHNDTIILV